MSIAIISDSDRADMDTYYRENVKLFYATIRRWMNKFGGDFDELLGECHLAFIKAWSAFDAGKGSSFATFLTTCITNRFRDLVKAKNIRRQRLGECDLSMYDITHNHRSHGDRPNQYTRLCKDWTNLRLCVSGLGEAVIDMVMALPVEVRESGRSCRRVVRDMLLSEGIPNKDISEVFNEIKRAL